MLEEEYIAQVPEEKDLTLTKKLLPKFLKSPDTSLQLMVNGTMGCRPLTTQTAEVLTITMVFARDIGGIIIILC